jgi:aldehyde dehydrogenase
MDTGTPPRVTTAGLVISGHQGCPSYVEVVNPASVNEVVGWCAMATTEDVESAVRTAAEAAPGWAAYGPHARSGLMLEAATAIEAEVEELTTLLTREQGKILAESRRDVSSASSMLRYYAGFADRLTQEETVPGEHAADLRVRRRPMGVTAIIVPWNVPVLLAFTGIAPALVAGNTVVVKPSEFAPLALTRVLELLAEHLPAGVVSVVNGDGTAGDALSSHPAVRKIFFTGSTRTGILVMKKAADHVASVSLELGGNDAAIVLPGADLGEDALMALVLAVFRNAGQVCFNVKRIYVHADIAEEFTAAFLRAADRLVTGPGDRPEVVVGPLNNQRQYDAVNRLIEDARARGARLIEVGTMADGTDLLAGWFIRPTVVMGLANDAPLVQQEQFGPVVPIITVSSDDEAVALANGTEYGLTASVWSRDVDRAVAVADRLEAGTVFVNAHTRAVTDQSMPFGGVKTSGVGRNQGFYGIEECTDLQSIAVVRPA